MKLIVIGFIIGLSMAAPPDSSDVQETYPYSSIFIKSINDKQAIECMKYVETTSFKIKNCTEVTTHNSCLCYFIKLVNQECETLRDDQVWYLENLNHAECTPR
ncbi:hypothetical protein Cantr_00222 [Candida viswanathii]|uniref:Uncharacterized protein n=1 Tax=Candida viswanathii TaxID=5486 RepID=A0A367YF45_9ASCO|nr:hypothetical protein Cantr_00222 [Candida viswanathii]